MATHKGWNISTEVHYFTYLSWERDRLPVSGSVPIPSHINGRGTGTLLSIRENRSIISILIASSLQPVQTSELKRHDDYCLGTFNVYSKVPHQRAGHKSKKIGTKKNCLGKARLRITCNNAMQKHARSNQDVHRRSKEPSCMAFGSLHFS